MKLIGLARLGRDAQVRDVNGQKVANLALAFNYGRKDDQGQRPTQWVDAALWGKLAESLEQYLIKGKQVECIVEDVHIETFTDRDGNLGHKLVGRVMSIELAGDGGQRAAAPAGQQQSAPAPRQAPAAPAAAPRPAAGGDRPVPF